MMELPLNLIAALWDVTLALSPWLLLGAVVAGLMHGLLPRDFIRTQLRGVWGVPKAVCVGVPLPLCSCGVIPAAMGLKRDGASSGSVMGFLISTPQTGMDSILVSASFLGWPFALFKVGSAAFTGLLGGWLTDVMDKQANASLPPEENVAEESKRGLAGMVHHSIDILESIWGWIVFGVVVSAALTTFVRPEWLASLGLQDGLTASLVVLLVSVPLYVCATASVPIAAALVALGMPTGAALVFLMAGPATNVATIGAVRKVFGGGTALLYVSVVAVSSIVLGLLFDNLIGGAMPLVEGHVHHSSWWEMASAVCLLLFLSVFAASALRQWWSKPKGVNAEAAHLTFAVAGMTCQGCVKRVQSAVGAIQGVTAVSVLLEEGRVSVQGNVDADELAEAIRTAGYDVS
jgi:copper ion binding protein